MSRRDEREIERRLRKVPGGEPPGDLLDRLRADLPGGAALREDAAARRRPPALGRRWLLAASLAGMTAAGLLALHTMEPMREARFAARPSAPSAAAAPEGGSPAAVSGASAPWSQPPLPATIGAPAPPIPSQPSGRIEESPRRLAASQLLREAPRSAAPPATPAPDRTAAPSPTAPAGSAPAHLDKIEVATTVSREELEKIPTSPWMSDEPSPTRASEGVAGGKPAALVTATAESPELKRAIPAAPSATGPLEAPKTAPDNLAQQRGMAGAERESFTLRSNAVVDGEEAVPPAQAPHLWAPEVAELAAAYDDDPPSADGWALAAGGTPPPPKVAGMPVHGPPAGALWVRFRVRALDPALAPAGARVEIAWTPGALRDRRLLGGEATSGEADVFPLSAGALRRGWTAVYEVRPALAPRASFERLATLRVVTAQGAPLREIPLPLSALSRVWMDAPSTLRLPCLAAAFAERRALGAPEGYVDLVAAARSLAVAHGRRDARAATLLELIVRADRVLPLAQP
jgi:hypothetical protein